MKIVVAPGRSVRLDARRSTSVRGGVYDVSDLDPKDRKALLRHQGVREEQPAAKATKSKEA